MTERNLRLFEPEEAPVPVYIVNSEDDPMRRIAYVKPDWYQNYSNIITLVWFMADLQCDADEIALAVEKPWNRVDDFVAAWDSSQDTNCDDRPIDIVMTPFPRLHPRLY